MASLRSAVFRRAVGNAISVSFWLSGGGADAALAATPDHSAPAVYALTHARLVVRPGEVIENGALVVRNGVVESIGTNPRIPNDARVLDFSGRTVFAGFIDANTDYAQREVPQSKAPALAELRGLTMNMPMLLQPDAVAADSLRRLGFTSVASQPQHGVFRGQTVVLTTEDAAHASDVIVASNASQSIAFDINPKDSEVYPVSPFGSSALIRQDAARHSVAEPVSDVAGASSRRTGSGSEAGADCARARDRRSRARHCADDERTRLRPCVESRN